MNIFHFLIILLFIQVGLQIILLIIITIFI